MVSLEWERAVQDSDVAVIEANKEAITSSPDPWAIHLSLFSAVQRVLNPPFINPHLPKMYNICRELAPHLSKEALASLVYLELVEYARRTKQEEWPGSELPRSQVAFDDIERAIASKDREGTTLLLSAFLDQRGSSELARRLLLLGSGYLTDSLGHSVSCTAFILREIIDRPTHDATPTLFLLANYFCRGAFHRTPRLERLPAGFSLGTSVARAVMGSGFVDIHHTITIYAVERMKTHLTSEEYEHMVASWVRFMGDKHSELPMPETTTPIDDYSRFFETFAHLDEEEVLRSAGAMVSSSADRLRLSSFLVTAVCDLYQGEYDPHYLTGLGAMLWVLNEYSRDVHLSQNALRQYLAFYFRGMRPGSRVNSR
jgi:hypothetical protein